MSADQGETAAGTIEAYYQALRDGEPLGPFFADEPGVVKFGISETLAGYERIVDGLDDQTETTADWFVESHDRSVTEREGFAWYHDDVRLAWTDAETGDMYDYETRWSGTLRPANGWQFVSLHVSTASPLEASG
ncbi:MAG: nuclear transport factor 2 family protein [Halapricum sp.]